MYYVWPLQTHGTIPPFYCQPPIAGNQFAQYGSFGRIFCTTLQLDFITKHADMKSLIQIFLLNILFTTALASQEVEYGIASFYSDLFHGKPTASGELY